MAPDDLRIRPETPPDYTEIRRVVAAAFDRKAEADLVETLREESDYRHDCSLVAVRTEGDDGSKTDPTGPVACPIADDVVGHVAFTDCSLVDHSEVGVVVLAPLSVAPVEQGQGVGSRLVRAGLAAVRESGAGLCFLHGDPDYYSRFGFVSAVGAEFENPLDLSDSAFQVAELREGVLARTDGSLRYPSVFVE